MLTYKIFILIAMILLHIVEDFHLQGILANMKQKSWWDKQIIDFPPKKANKYRKDYIISLIIHSLENSIFITLPIIINDLYYTFTVNKDNSLWITWMIYIWLNSYYHYLIDDLKCNKMKINLIIDQLLHLVMIVFIWLCHWNYLGQWM